MITKINEIQVNDIIELRGGDSGVVISFNNELYINIDGIISPMSPFNEEFTITDSPNFDIMFIRRPSTTEQLEPQNWKTAPIVWQRDSTKKMTVEEVSQALGYEVEIVE